MASVAELSHGFSSRFMHKPCVSSACLGDHCTCGHDWPCKTIEKQIRDAYYGDDWWYLNHAGYDKARDDAAFAKFRDEQLTKLSLSTKV